ncbi:MAG: M15 family metallopeptidase [Clostridia bacterium]|nr:M15 family metallopeptidase [Clostridia bacterium]MDR3644649.1 M15 family metallopeptidase [Clostridia bacterium]
MYGIYKNNVILFAAVVLALLLCLPFLAPSVAAKKQAPLKAPASSAVTSSKTAADDDSRFTAAGLVNLARMNAGFVFNLRYATTNNFTGTKLYGAARAFLRAGTAQKLAAANREFMSMGYRIKIFDAYRPYTIQKILFSKVPSGRAGYIANPYKGGSNHNRGAAVDMTLVHLDGSPVAMPSDFDTFNERASIYYKGCTKQQAADRELMAAVMVRHGFKRLPCEWWHFDDTDVSKYGLIDIVF